ncbi:hypothetical protein Q9233_000839 [Columba guinea]|nr:hypothetical protein Q9233_000839 [Columba guinea]
MPKSSFAVTNDCRQIPIDFMFVVPHGPQINSLCLLGGKKYLNKILPIRSHFESLRHLLEKQQCSKNLAHLKLATSNADFTFRLYKQIMTEKDDRNVLFSPLTKISLDGHRGVEDL